MSEDNHDEKAGVGADDMFFFLTFQRIGCQPAKTTLHGGQSRCSWSAEQEKK